MTYTKFIKDLLTFFLILLGTVNFIGTFTTPSNDIYLQMFHFGFFIICIGFLTITAAIDELREALTTGFKLTE